MVDFGINQINQSINQSCSALAGEQLDGGGTGSDSSDTSSSSNSDEESGSSSDDSRSETSEESEGTEKYKLYTQGLRVGVRTEEKIFKKYSVTINKSKRQDNKAREEHH